MQITIVIKNGCADSHAMLDEHYLDNEITWNDIFDEEEHYEYSSYPCTIISDDAYELRYYGFLSKEKLKKLKKFVE